MTAAAPALPHALLGQLRDDGIMIVPIETEEGHQQLMRVTREGDTYVQRPLCKVQFVPLVSE